MTNTNKKNSKNSTTGVTQNLGYQIKVKVTFKNGVTQTLRPSRKSKIARSAVLTKMKSGYLRVTYGPGSYNHGTYDNKKDFLQALNEFTEPELIKYAKGGVWM